MKSFSQYSIRQYRMVASAIIVIAGFILMLFAHVATDNPNENDDIKDHMKRADVIKIDLFSYHADSPDEEPPVFFLHDLHTDMLESEGQDCMTCHLKEDNGYLSLKFMRFEDPNKQTLTDIYHSDCIGCHKQRYESNKNAGPMECSGCHVETPSVVPHISPFGFDKSLHFRHWKKYEKKCDTCHLAYDAKSKKIKHYRKEYTVRRISDKTKWDVLFTKNTCRYCHTKNKDFRLSMRDALHIACLACHKKTIAKNEKAGPVRCSGCHDAREQKMIQKLKNVPRIESKQPDAVFVSLTDSEKEMKNRMNSVLFDHKSHEEYTDTCRVCHHAKLTKCSGCHTLLGSKDGNYVTLKQSMHRSGTERSCMGCHEIVMSEKKCAGCHLKKNVEKMKLSSCMKCHITPLINSIEIESRRNEKERLAIQMLAARKEHAVEIDDNDSPEKVFIDVLAEQYKPVVFPHRKIVKKIMENIKGNKIASCFHDERNTICQGCHHNSPASLTPSPCASCHGKSFDEDCLTKPGLMGAYHRKCIGCHEEMGIEKPSYGCTECHKKIK